MGGGLAECELHVCSWRVLTVAIVAVVSDCKDMWRVGGGLLIALDCAAMYRSLTNLYSMSNDAGQCSS